MNYKVFNFALSTALILSMVACGDKKQTQNPDDQNKPASQGSKTEESTTPNNNLPKETHAFVGNPATTPVTDQFVEDMSFIAQSFIDKHYSKGIVLGYVTPEGVSYKALGNLADTEKPEEVNFQLASNTKVFVGMAFASMVNDGVVTFDTPLAKCAPSGVELPSKFAETTLGQLATHTAGLPLDMPGIKDTIEFYSNVSAADLWAKLSRAKKSNVDTFSYSNYGVALLGAALANCDHMDSWESLVAKRVTGVLGLEGIKMDLEVTPGYNYNMDELVPWSWEKRDAAGHAGLRGNAKDLARLIQLSLADEDFYGHNMLKLSQTAKLKHIYDSSVANDGVGYNWFIGYDVQLGAGLEKAVWHGGASNTHTSMFVIDKEAGHGIIFLDNSNETILYYIISLAFELYNSGDKDSIMKQLNRYWPELYAATAADMEPLVGDYKYGSMGAKIYVRDGELLADIDYAGLDKQLRLLPLSKVSWQVHGVGQFDFSKNAEGNVSGFALKLVDGQVWSFNKIAVSAPEEEDKGDSASEVEDAVSDVNVSSGNVAVAACKFNRQQLMGPSLPLVNP